MNAVSSFLLKRGSVKVMTEASEAMLLLQSCEIGLFILCLLCDPVALMLTSVITEIELLAEI